MTIEVSQEQAQPVKRKSKVLKLKVYTNKIKKQAEKESKEYFKTALSTLKELIPAPTGYALVAWDEEGNVVNAWSTTCQREIRYIPQMVADILRREIDKYTEEQDVSD